MKKNFKLTKDAYAAQHKEELDTFNKAVRTLMKLNSSHIEFVLDCMQENTTKIRNIKQYLKAVLFNAPSTIDSYYTSLVAHDMASGALAPRKPKYGDPDYYTYNEGESL